MISITERLRARQEPVGDGSGKWRKDGLCQEAADVVDALVAALEDGIQHIILYPREYDRAILEKVAAALAKAKGKQDT